ncbi:hypothetical protein LCGC14_1859330 [marine sediment metagenome]|mgnify:CR=1|uniref:Uncharacterized protein n=1 Tax=marine sediment metagenome TaxID=412755 RepID=A0A0F9G8A6_9ZZZZ
MGKRLCLNPYLQLRNRANDLIPLKAAQIQRESIVGVRYPNLIEGVCRTLGLTPISIVVAASLPKRFRLQYIGRDGG